MVTVRKLASAVTEKRSAWTTHTGTGRRGGEGQEGT
jgi:hypothetical protein